MKKQVKENLAMLKEILEAKRVSLIGGTNPPSKRAGWVND
jgi:hypothetical protein